MLLPDPGCVHVRAAAPCEDPRLRPVRCACIDIGSNTTRLLIAEPDGACPGALREIAARRAFIRLTAEDRRSGVPASKAQRITAAVAEQAGVARAAGVTALRVVATAALREASGREALLARLQAAAGIRIDVLSEEEEARLTFAGATAALPAAQDRVMVADVGGGSTELAIGIPGGEAQWWTSLPIGSGLLADAHLRTDPPAPAELDAARARARAAIATVDCPGADRAWAVGGSATSLRRLVGEQVTAPALAAVLEVLCARPAHELARELGLHVERVRLLPAGLILLAEIAQAGGCPLHIGSGGLREGVVLDLLARVG